MMSINKILGYVLLILALLLIAWTLWQSYNIFTNKSSAPLVFTTPAAVNSSAKNAGLLDVSGQVQIQLQDALGQQIGQMISVDSITKVLNLLSWSILAAILIFGGSVIAGIGVKLIKF